MEMNFIAFSCPGNCVCTQYAALSRALQLLRPKKKIVVFQVPCQEKIGSVGRLYFFFFFFFVF